MSTFLRRRESSVLALPVLLACLAAVPAHGQSGKKAGPESFHAKARIGTGTSAADALVEIRINQYTAERDVETMKNALASGGHDAFVAALRRAPEAGTFDFGGKSFTIRWARQVPTERGRLITLVTDSPVYFVGAGAPDAKSRAGFEVAVIRLVMDSSGIGEGTMAAAARIKAGGPTGVDVEDYGNAPVKLVSVFRVIS